ncbi:transcriptional repressor [candidate division WOR-3 bacterium JGI_Cruoil_03_44_89]|uniref:Transcriptional repressor n=1 Tax=candidate division WOR-3 bacterium JGI_Cruoil_03_44_89 TaxID=1973748 RepID=A0A235BRH3_UNCW3|nr:MAG: transcriptional repressor [candidate division WOR-3 bacterium JGI_Cruoil_03_44_89]
MNKRKELTMDKLREYLDKKNIHPSYHRLKILKYLMEHKTHPTVDMIYKDLSKEIATLSKTTIYNTLSLFLKEGIISCLTIDENKIMYDYNTKPHVHFICIKCGCVYDIHLKCPIFDKEIIEGHKITEYHIYLKGICKECLKNA